MGFLSLQEFSLLLLGHLLELVLGDLSLLFWGEIIVGQLVLVVEEHVVLGESKDSLLLADVVLSLEHE